MKKAVVLLITLFFITSISVFVLKNLDDTNKILGQKNYKIDFSQGMILTENIQEEISQKIKLYPDKVKEFIELGYLNQIPFKIKDINITFSLQEYDKENINELKNENAEKLNEYLEKNNFFEYPILQDIYKNKLEKNSNIEDYKQLDDIIQDFTEQNYSNKLKNLKEDLGFLNGNDYYSLAIKVSMAAEALNSYYILNKENGGVEYFEISFK